MLLCASLRCLGQNWAFWCAAMLGLKSSPVGCKTKQNKNQPSVIVLTSCQSSPLIQYSSGITTLGIILPLILHWISQAIEILPKQLSYRNVRISVHLFPLVRFQNNQLVSDNLKRSLVSLILVFVFVTVLISGNYWFYLLKLWFMMPLILIVSPFPMKVHGPDRST